MHYDDSSRRLNLLTGLVVGAALGAGLALLLAPQAPVRITRVVERGVRRVRRAGREGVEAARTRGAERARAAIQRFQL
jgi:gas vesicle protein